MKKRNKINTGKSKIGAFTRAAKKAGMSEQEFAKKVLANKHDYSPTIIKKANFTITVAKWEKKEGGPVKYQKGKLINVSPGSFSKSEDQKSTVPSWVNWGVPSKPGNYKRNFPDKSGYLLPSISTLTLDPNWKNNLIPSIVQRPKRVHPKLKGRANPSKVNLQLKPKKNLPTKFNPKFKLNTPKDKVNHPIFGKYKKVSKPSGFDASFDYNPNNALSFTGKINPELKNKDSDPTIQIGGKYKNILDFGYNTDFKGSNLNLGLNNKYFNAVYNTDFEGANKLALKAKYKELFGVDFDTNFKENYNIGVKAGPFSGRFSNADNIKNLDLSLKHKNIGLKVNTDLQGKEKFNISSEKELGPVKIAANYNINRDKDKLSHDIDLKGDIKFDKKFSLSPSLVSDITNQKNKLGLSAKISPNKNITFTPKVSWSPDQYSIGTGINWKPNKMLNIGADINYGNEGLAGNVSLKAALNNAKLKPTDLFNNKRKGGLVKYQEGETIQSKTNTLIEGNPLFNKYIPNPIVKEVNTESPHSGMVGYIPAGERDPQGNIINPSDRPLIELYKRSKNLSNNEKLNMIKGDLLHALTEDPKWKTLVHQVWENRDDLQKRVDKNAYDGRNGIYAKDERGNLIEDEEGRLTKIGEKSSDDLGYDNRPFDKWANVSRKDALVRGFIMKYPNMKNVYNKKQLEILNSMEGYLNNQNPNFHHLGNTTTYKGDNKRKGGLVKKDLKGTYTSSAQRLMDDNDLDPSYITASNENGRIYKGDVSKALKSLNNYGAGFPNALDYKKVGVLPKNKIKYSKNTLIGPVGMPPYRWKSYKTPIFNHGGQIPHQGTKVSMKMLDENDMLPPNDSDRLSYRDKPVGFSMSISKSMNSKYILPKHQNGSYTWDSNSNTNNVISTINPGTNITISNNPIENQINLETQAKNILNDIYTSVGFNEKLKEEYNATVKTNPKYKNLYPTFDHLLNDRLKSFKNTNINWGEDIPQEKRNYSVFGSGVRMGEFIPHGDRRIRLSPNYTAKSPSDFNLAPLGSDINTIIDNKDNKYTDQIDFNLHVDKLKDQLRNTVKGSAAYYTLLEELDHASQFPINKKYYASKYNKSEFINPANSNYWKENDDRLIHDWNITPDALKTLAKNIDPFEKRTYETNPTEVLAKKRLAEVFLINNKQLKPGDQITDKHIDYLYQAYKNKKLPSGVFSFLSIFDESPYINKLGTNSKIFKTRVKNVMNKIAMNNNNNLPIVEDGGNIARTEDEFEEGLNAGKNVFPFGQKGLKKMTSTPPSGDMEVPINIKGFTDGEQTDEQVMLPGEDVNIDGDTVVETPDLSSMDLNKAFDYANSKKFPIFMWKGNEYKLKRHLKKKHRGGLFSNKVTDHVKLNPGFSPDVK